MKLGFFPDGIFFDLDGTLWDSVAGIAASWQRCLARYPQFNIHFDLNDVRSCMGLCIDDIAHRLMPHLEENLRMHLMEECLEEEHRHLREVGGEIYPHVEETLLALKKRAPLFIVSNCEQGYIENFLEVSGFGSCFLDHISFGDSKQQKGANTLALIKKYGLKQPVFVGDALVDQLAADEVQIPFIWAAYGFGKVEHYDFVIQEFCDLLALLEN